MYSGYYDILSYVMLFVRYAATSVLCLSYTRSFLKEKNGRKITFLLWNILYLLGALTLYFAFNTVNVIQNLLCLTLKTVFLFMLQRLLFQKGGAVNLFTVLSFLVGRDLTVSVMSVVFYRYLWDGLFNIMLNCSGSIETTAEIAAFNFRLFLLDALTTAIAVAGYVGLLALYLKIIKKSFRKKDYRLQRRESVFLILPLISSLCISVTVRIMEFNESGAVYYDIFDIAPAAMLFIPLVDILLLGTNIAVVILFQSLVDYNEEKSKRDLLENQIAQMRGEITEIRDIYSDIRGLRHDMKNHIENISLYVQRTGDNDKLLSEYIGSMEKAVDRLDFSYSTGNPICDIILHRKRGEAEKNGISFSSDFTFPKTDKLDPYDIGVILSNSLENAIEANSPAVTDTDCEKAEDNIYISLRSYEKGSLFFIETENTYTRELKYSGGLPVSSKQGEGHGYGLSNIERTAKKYMGGIDITTEERNGTKIFCLTVMLNTNSS